MLCVLLTLMMAWAGTAAAHPLESMHTDPIAPVILGVTGILFFAILGRFAARKLGQPSVLGELIMGVVLGNLAYFIGIDLIMVLREGPAIFDLVNLSIAGEPLDMAAFQTLGSDTAAQVLWILQGPHGSQILQIGTSLNRFHASFKSDFTVTASGAPSAGTESAFTSSLMNPSRSLPPPPDLDFFRLRTGSR